MGTLHETGEFTDGEDDEVHKPVWWTHNKHDRRVCGVDADTYPRPEGWTIDGKEVSLDKLGIKQSTRIFAKRKFKPPVCEKAWETRLGITLPWPKIWRMKSFFATPRDMIVGLKVQHRNLYVGKRDPVRPNCRACDDPNENILHLAQCPIIRLEFWDEVIVLLIKLGMPRPQHVDAFIVTGTLDQNKAISRLHSGVWFLAWRCLYAAMVTSRVEDTTLDLEKAFKRLVAMIISRLRAYGYRWRTWVGSSWFRHQPNVIGRKNLDKKLISFTPDGEYTINEAILKIAKDLEILRY
jgi:hypothetical protein